MLQTVTNKCLKSNDLWFINWEIEKEYHEIIDNNRKNRIVLHIQAIQNLRKYIYKLKN